MIDDFLPKRPGGRGRPRQITDAEVITLLVAQALLQIPDDRRFIATARRRLGHLFPYLPKQPGYSKRVRALFTPQIERAINYLAYVSPSFCDGLRLLDSTPVPCAASRQTTRRSEFAGSASYGYYRKPLALLLGLSALPALRSRWDTDPFELAAANEPECKVAKKMLERVSLTSYTVIVIADKGLGAPAGGVGILEPQAWPGAPRRPHPALAFARGSGRGCWPSQPPSGTTGRSVSRAGT